eukprot:gene28424-31566_t
MSMGFTTHQFLLGAPNQTPPTYFPYIPRVAAPLCRRTIVAMTPGEPRPHAWVCQAVSDGRDLMNGAGAGPDESHHLMSGGGALSDSRMLPDSQGSILREIFPDYDQPGGWTVGPERADTGGPHELEYVIKTLSEDHVSAGSLLPAWDSSRSLDDESRCQLYLGSTSPCVLKMRMRGSHGLAQVPGVEGVHTHGLLAQWLVEEGLDGRDESGTGKRQLMNGHVVQHLRVEAKTWRDVVECVEGFGFHMDDISLSYSLYTLSRKLPHPWQTRLTRQEQQKLMSTISRLSARMLDQMYTFRPASIAAALSGLTPLDSRKLAGQLAPSLVHSMYQQLGSASTRDIVACLYALSSLKVNRSQLQPFIIDVMAKVLPNMKQLSPQETASLLFASTKLAFIPTKKWMEVYWLHCAAVVPSLAPMQLLLLLRGITRIRNNFKPPTKVVHACMDRFFLHLDDFKPSQVAGFLATLSKLKLKPNKPAITMKALQAHVESNIHTFSPEDISLLIGGLAGQKPSANMTPTELWLLLVAKNFVAKIHQASPRSISRFVGGLATLCPEPTKSQLVPLLLVLVDHCVKAHVLDPSNVMDKEDNTRQTYGSGGPQASRSYDSFAGGVQPRASQSYEGFKGSGGPLASRSYDGFGGNGGPFASQNYNSYDGIEEEGGRTAAEVGAQDGGRQYRQHALTRQNMLDTFLAWQLVCGLSNLHVRPPSSMVLQLEQILVLRSDAASPNMWRRVALLFAATQHKPSREMKMLEWPLLQRVVMGFAATQHKPNSEIEMLVFTVDEHLTMSPDTCLRLLIPGGLVTFVLCGATVCRHLAQA